MGRSVDSVHAPIMWALTAAFAVRVAGQAIQRWLPQPFLPPFDRWQGSGTPYSVLLLAQLLILGLMARTSWRASRRIRRPAHRLGRRLAWFGGIYLAAAVTRVAVGLAVPSAPAWFSAWISGALHVVLAAFVLTAAHYHLSAASESRGPP